MRILRYLWVVPLAAAHAQPAVSPTFDVASVKPGTDEGPTININLGTAHHGVVTLTNVTLGECIQFAYGLVSQDQISGPDWLRDRTLRVDIVAKAATDTPMDQLLQMTQRLLAERFALVLHREARPLKHFELTIARNGPKLPEAKGDGPSFAPVYRRGILQYSHIPMHIFALLLSRQLKEVVLDKTGLAGFYDTRLTGPLTSLCPRHRVARAEPSRPPTRPRLRSSERCNNKSG